MRLLRERQRRFVDAYVGQAAGNATRAARIAGYGRTEGAVRVTATRLLTKANIRASIDAIQAQRTQEAIATANETDAALSAIIRDESASASIRIQACSELNRCRGRHSHRMRRGGGMTLEQLVVASRR